MGIVFFHHIKDIKLSSIIHCYYKKSANSLIAVLFSLAVFRFFSLSLVSCNFAMICLEVNFFIYTCLELIGLPECEELTVNFCMLDIFNSFKEDYYKI